MKKDLTIGKPITLILAFALPLMLSNLFQQFYNLADTSIVGHFLGDNALSAIGSVSILFGLLTSLCFGMTNGFSILIARYFGAGDEKKMRQAIAGTVVLSVAITIILTLVWVIFLKPFMRFMHTPDEIFDDAYSYIIVIISMCVVMMFYNMLAFILRALGNSKTPLIFLIISSILNIGLDLLFVVVFKWGLPGAAWATVLAQLISGMSCLIYIQKNFSFLRLSKEDFHFEKHMLPDLLASGAAMSLMYAIVNIGTLILQSGINGLGKDIIASHTAARKLSELFMMTGGAFSSTIATFTSQNYGAGKKDRIWEGVKAVHLLGAICAIIVVTVVYLFSDKLIAAVSGTSNPDIIAAGAKYLKINTPFYLFCYELCFVRSSLQGLGSKIWPLVGSILELLGKWAVVQFFIAPLGYTAVCFSEPATWIICGILVAVVFLTNKEMRPVIFKGKQTM